MRISARVIIALAIFASLISFAKFSHCDAHNWQSPDQYIHACYTDIPALYSERGLDKGVWAYSSAENAVEYPVVTGTVMWAIAKIAPDNYHSYYLINVALLALLFIFIAFITYRIKPEYGYLLSFSPAVIASLYINWDLWAIATMLLAIYWFDRNRYEISALALGISISTKFMPIFLLLPIALIFFRSQKLRDGLKYLAIVAGTFLVINAPVFLTTPQGWLRFYTLNLERQADWGSLLYALSAFGLNLTHFNYLSILALLIGFTSIIIFLLQLKRTPKLAELSFIVLATVMLVSKVYSPQYVLWLVPLAIIALNSSRDLFIFWLWQGAELIYHIAIWQHLALETGAKFGLPLAGYAAITLIRIAATAALILRLAASRENSHTSPREFLFQSAESYP